ncbi:MAG TPA: hypothetical protein VL361_12520 [Candidatus Limnocylindrales bacterium]|jgi:hypothetical protein|nr:hypothetical protein [Candidatus Limnocylindrales bacterium]
MNHQPFTAKARLLLALAVLLSGAREIVAAESAQAPAAASPAKLSLAVFDIDATPPIGTMMAYDPVTNKWDLGLRARGVVLLGAGDPIVLCAIDWIGIANEAHDAFCARLAVAAGTSPERVAVHTLHQHDAPDCDFSAEEILKKTQQQPRQFESSFQRQVLSQLEQAVQNAMRNPQPINYLGLGEARVEGVASNRRILGSDGKVRAVRYTSCQDAALRAEPEGTIDSMLSLVSFWNGDRPVAVLSYYATHPQSYYRTGIPNPDFPGVARFMRQLAVPAALHVHFNGAGGNIGAGKYNDGSHENRGILAERLAEGMRRAWESTKKEPLASEMVGWTVEKVALPPAKDLDERKLQDQLKEANPRFFAIGGPSRLAWLQRCRAGHHIDVTCLRLGRARIMHMPGELFVEYQLAAKAERRDLFVAMAAYGDYGPWYIGTAKAYDEGGYETTPPASNVGPGAETELLRAIHKLLQE